MTAIDTHSVAGPAAQWAAAWRAAHGAPVMAVAIRSTAEDFQVDEELGFSAAGDGEHDLLRIRKSGTNTQWLARQLAKYAGVRAVDVGFAGLKDRHAVTTQYFTVRRPDRLGTDWSGFAVDGVRVLEIARHNRKLRRGAHTANYFRLVLRAPDIKPNQPLLAERWQKIAELGVPNYFGPQRFGRDYGNLDLARAVFRGKRVRREQRGIAISAARAWLFNEILSRRVADGTWDHIVRGDLANLDGTRSIFSVAELDADLEARCAAYDIHPTASLWGDGAPAGTLQAAELEQASVEHWRDLADGLVRARVATDSRATRLRPTGASIAFGDGFALLDFRLPRGGFATSVLRELATQS